MRSRVRVFAVTAVLALPLGGCGGSTFNFDPTDWTAGDWFGNKKPLPGERKAVFPQGVPGVAKGLPPEVMSQQQRAAAEAQQQQAMVPQEPADVEEEKPKAQPKARPKPKPKPAVAATTDEEPPRQPPARQPAQQQQQQQQIQWPDPPSSGPRPQLQWPDPPPAR